MKKKNIKLSLKKETIAKLNNVDMNNIEGGSKPATVWHTCITSGNVPTACFYHCRETSNCSDTINDQTCAC
ncbi:MAG: hypothetical protein GYA62_07735 [Bacteroidales bacterium]|nr:hypothetical protein [Bacteroidales bacterium]